MSSIRLSGTSSGYYDLTVPAVAGTNSIDLSNLPVKDSSNNLNITGKLGVGNTTPHGTYLLKVGPVNTTETIAVQSAGGGSETIMQSVSGSDSRIGSSANTPLNLITNNVSRMTIDTSGRITTPYQPCFDVASNQSVAANNYQTFNVQYHNVGNHFSLANNRFTAPVNGLYQFFATTIKSGAASGSVTRVYVYVNGAVTNGQRHVRLSEGANYGTNGVGSWIISMSAGDYAQVYISSGGSHSSTEYTYFNGYLLQ